MKLTNEQDHTTGEKDSWRVVAGRGKLLHKNILLQMNRVNKYIFFVNYYLRKILIEIHILFILVCF